MTNAAQIAEKIAVTQDENYYAITSPDGSVYVQRKHALLASDAPMFLYEEVICQLCACMIAATEQGEGE